MTILKHKMVDHFRKTYREKPLDTEHEIPPDPSMESFDSKGRWSVGPQSWQVDPNKVEERKQFWQVLQKCLDTLPERLAHIFTLRELDDLSTEELCKVFNITPTNLWVILHRARNRLRRCFESRWLQT